MICSRIKHLERFLIDEPVATSSESALAKALMSGRARTVMARQLAGLIQQRLGAQAPPPGYGPLAIPMPLLTLQLAHGQLALVEEWLSGRYSCSAAQIAAALKSTSQATVHAHFGRLR